MTAGRFEAPRQGEPEMWAENWSPSGTWDDAEAWDYDEARARPEAYELLEARFVRERASGPRFNRFEAAIAAAPPAMAGTELRARTLRTTEPTWREASRSGRLWAGALWLVGAAGAGVLAGLVTTHLVTLALQPAASDVRAQHGAPRSVLSTPAPWSVTSLAQASARQVPGRDRSGPTAAAARETASRIEPAGPVAAFPADPAAPVQIAAPAALPPVVLAAANVTAEELAATPRPSAAQARVTPLPSAPAASAPASQYRVQLAMLRDQRNVEYVWHDFVAQFGPSAKKLHRYVLPTQTARGTRHLVQVGPFVAEREALAACSKLKQRGGDCLVVREPS